MLHCLSILLLLFTIGCDRAEKSSHANIFLVERLSTDPKEPPLPLKERPLPLYPWEKGKKSRYPVITKEFFRCMGSKLHAAKTTEKPPLSDCDGFLEHSLPIVNGEEFIYPCLIEVLNEIQNRTGHQVVITSGHRCLKHHLFVKLPEEKKSSKHLMGAEVTFYVKELEGQPEQVIQAIEAYFKDEPLKRSQQDDPEVITRSYFNKEIYLKLYLPNEGRDGDNQHGLSYFRMTVRWDRDKKKSVPFRWDLVEKNLLQW